MRGKQSVEHSTARAGTRVSYDDEITANTLDHLPRLLEKKKNSYFHFVGGTVIYFLLLAAERNACLIQMAVLKIK